MPLWMMGVPGMAAGAGMAYGLGTAGARMGAGRYATAAGAGGMILGPDTYGTRSGARMGAAVGAGYGMYSLMNTMAPTYGAGMAGVLPEVGALKSAGIRDLITGTSGVAEGLKDVSSALRTQAHSAGLRSVGERMGIIGDMPIGMVGYAQKAGRVGRAFSPVLKAGAVGAVAGGLVYGAANLLTGGGKVRSNQPVY